MQNTFTTLFENVFKQKYSDSHNLSFLENITNKQPYFSLAHFYALHHTSKNDKSYDAKISTTALHFNNHFWLQYQLNEASNFQSNSINEPEILILEEDKNIFKTKEVELVKSQLDNPVEFILKKQDENLNHNQMLFEPMHMVDYFASQGIKLSADVLKSDKLGTQLKSFTQWLKTMKKIHVNDLPLDSDQNQNAIKNQAEKSNTEDEVLTEAMAEVLTKQGKFNQAKVVYEKLSLLDSSKMAYFASKIQQLQVK